MLSDHEQRALLELQRQFLAEDPDLDEVGQRDSGFSFQWVDAMPRWVPTAAVVGTDRVGYTGKGFVDYNAASGDFVEFSVAAPTLAPKL